jgi:hypothetical protein
VQVSFENAHALALNENIKKQMQANVENAFALVLNENIEEQAQANVDGGETST